MSVSLIPLKYDMSLLSLRDIPYRTRRLTAVMAVPLRESTAAEYAILPDLLLRCCRAYPTVPEMSRRLDSLYGASLESRVIRLGGWQVLRFSIAYLQSQYTLGHEDLTEDCIGLLLDALFDPVLENGGFRQEDFDEEQRCLTEHLQSEINNKRAYARRRCEQLLCPDHPFSVNPSGTLETVRALTPASVAAARERLLSTARIRWIYQGESDPEPLCRAIEKRFSVLPSRRAVLPEYDASFAVKETSLTETMELKQAKFVMGLRIAVTEPDGNVMAARLMNSLLGGTPSSLLFRHIREEQSLCYYCSSSYDRTRGILLIESGIRAADADRVRDGILQQLEAIRRGDFSDDELEDARRALIQQFASMDETAADREVHYLSQTLYDRYISPEETGARLREVTRDEVCQAARLTTLDTVYLLRPTESEKEVAAHD